MERLTNKREADAQREEYERRLANGYPRNIPEERFLRLAAYEHTGIEPEAVETVKLALAAKHMVDLETLNNTPISRLVELAEADRAGRVIVLPAKKGDTWKKAMSILDKKYAEAKKLPFVRDPLAWALYHTWKEFDDGKRCD